jgi:hypothetical protein
MRRITDLALGFAILAAFAAADRVADAGLRLAARLGR